MRVAFKKAPKAARGGFTVAKATPIAAFKLAPKAALKGAVRAYQAVHPAFFSGSCRFHPTCSHYALEALETHGALRGTVLTAHRIWRCQPLYPAGFDPVPPRGPLWRALAAWRYLGPTPWQHLSAGVFVARKRAISFASAIFSALPRTTSPRLSVKNLNASPTDVKARMP